MKIITERTLIRGVAEAWRRQYPRNHKTWRTAVAPDTDTIYRMLADLDPETSTAVEVERIIGNGSWTHVPKCDECQREGLPLLIEVGEDRGYESATARLCPDCLHRAVATALDAQRELNESRERS